MPHDGHTLTGTSEKKSEERRKVERRVKISKRGCEAMTMIRR